MKIIVGLGNPGEKYQHTRHNLGFKVIDEYAQKHLGPEIKWQVEDKFNSEVLELNLKDQKILLVKPQTSMNSSGVAVSKLTSFYKSKNEDLIIVYDELDLPLGKIKVRCGGASAGHHGLESILGSLGDDKFCRVRLGIGNIKSQAGERKGAHFDVTKFVVEEFMQNEKSKVKHMIKQAIEALDLLVMEGLEQAQNQYN